MRRSFQYEVFKKCYTIYRGSGYFHVFGKQQEELNNFENNNNNNRSHNTANISITLTTLEFGFLYIFVRLRFHMDLDILLYFITKNYSLQLS